MTSGEGCGRSAKAPRAPRHTQSVHSHAPRSRWLTTAHGEGRMTEHDSTRTETEEKTSHGAVPRRGGFDPLMQVRATDVQPYTGLGYLSKLFRLIAIFLVLLLAVEVGTGFYQQGRDA